MMGMFQNTKVPCVTPSNDMNETKTRISNLEETIDAEYKPHHTSELE